MINTPTKSPHIFSTLCLALISLLSACSTTSTSPPTPQSQTQHHQPPVQTAGLTPVARSTITYSTSFATNPLPATISHDVITKLAQDAGFSFRGTVPPLNQMHFQNTTAEQILQQLANSSGQIAIIDPSSASVSFAPIASLHIYIPSSLPSDTLTAQLKTSSIPITHSTSASRTHLTITGNYRQLAVALAQTRQHYGPHSTHIEVQLSH